MPVRGRPRLTSADYETRAKAYCAKYGVALGHQGLPPFPAGRRETPQHREWMGLYKLRHRLGRRERRQCERCGASISDGSVFCDTHRGENSGRAVAHGASVEQRRELFRAQGGRCPICGQKVDVSDRIDQCRSTGRLRAILHQRCNQVVGLAELAGPGVLERLRAYLWPMVKPQTRR